MTDIPTISVTTPELRDNPIESTIECANEKLDKDLESASVNSKAQSMSLLPKGFYQNKSILLTGATGFIGKAVLWKLIQSFSDSFDKLYILLRPTRLNQHSPEGRFKDDILSNKAFISLRGTMGVQLFDNLIQKKVFPIFGDLTESNLGLSDDTIEMLKKEINIFYNCAGNVDGNETLEASIRTNTLGTLELFNLAKQCENVSVFTHLSVLQPDSNENYLHPLNRNHSATDNLQDILDQQEPADFKPLYKNAYLYSKSLAEHILADEVRKMPKGQTFPVSIVRLASVGPSVQEPLIGWADGVSGMNGIILLVGRGNRVIPTHFGNHIIDIVPVDYAVRLIIGFQIVSSVPEYYSVPTIAHRPRKLSSSNLDSDEESCFIPPRESSLPPMPTLPKIQHITISHKRPLTWLSGYEAIRQYWAKAMSIQLPSSAVYFELQNNDASPVPSRARTMMDSIRNYYYTPAPADSSAPSTHDYNSKRSSHRLSRAIDKAAKLVNSNSLFGYHSMQPHSDTILKFQGETDPESLIPEDVDSAFWYRYLTNASYGVHFFVCGESNLRAPTPVQGWTCAIHTYKDTLAKNEEDGYNAVLRQAKSSVFSQDEIAQRNTRMILHIKNTILQVNQENKSADDIWLNDLDDSLDDWSQDNEVSLVDERLALGKWRKKVGSNSEAVKIIVLNDKRVNSAIQQITQKAGVPKQTATNEAIKILMRMSERTQLAFVWFTASFLRSLLDNMFENVWIGKDSLRTIRQMIAGKRVVYVPTSKSVLDQLLVWYVAIRYHLPVPALACDESTMQMGSISDIYRLAGAYYVKRDKSRRSPLNSAVTAAYTQVLLRDHGALSFTLERSRSRTGKVQEAYSDGLIGMVVESTLQTNQSRASSTAGSSSSALSRIVSSELTTPPESPSSVSSIDSLVQIPSFNNPIKSIHKDVVIVPINITYENVPELSHLIDEVLDQQPSKHKRTPSNVSSLSSPLPSQIIRPSEAKDRRKTTLDISTQKKYGRTTFGIGPLVSVQEMAEKHQSDMESYESVLVSAITRKVQESQLKGLVVSSVSMVASIVLYGRATHGICAGKIKELTIWLRQKIIQDGYQTTLEEGEDLDLTLLNAFRLLDEAKNIVIEGKEIHDDTNIRVNDHADNVMTLSYYSNQMTNLLLLDSFFAVVYLSFLDRSVMEDDFKDRFMFLIQLLEREFVLEWDAEEKLKELINTYVERKILEKNSDELLLMVNMENDVTRYEQLMYMASLIYPTIDAYWITSCSLSALEAIPMLPRSIIPLLTQWIATHLITGRRTIYREVLSTESSRVALDVFMSMGFLTEIKAKEKLSPDAQILLHEFGIPTTEILIELAGQNSDGGKTQVSPKDPEGMIKAVMAQIQMNRANSNMADLCQQIDSYRMGAASQRESFQNLQVFQKCLKQIKRILEANTSIVKKRQLYLQEDEANLVQLIYSLLASSAPADDKAAKARALRRISEAYNLS
ncbi:male sterility protein-domain-containing protein [Sporodiniella umbellata]|nr:male sterility protein-domain-containing protein [Sporodiniella umbellata]